MEFKGTKEFPKYEGGDNYSIDLIFENGSTISVDRYNKYSDDSLACSREEMEANALLISKAPEMLEMLIEISRRINILKTEPEGIIKEQMIYLLDEGIEQLIKQATKL